MGKLSWKFIERFFTERGMKPDEAFKILKAKWIDTNYTDYVSGSIFKSKSNRTDFIEYVEYVYGYMEKHNVKWIKALEQLHDKNDQRTLRFLDYLLLQNPYVEKITLKKSTFIKHMKHWRQIFFDKKWLYKDEVPQILNPKVTYIKRKMKKGGLLQKKKRKKK